MRNSGLDGATSNSDPSKRIGTEEQDRGGSSFLMQWKKGFEYGLERKTTNRMIFPSHDWGGERHAGRETESGGCGGR